MKFLRTKTTIFEVVEENKNVYRVKSKKDPNNIYSKSKSDSDIIRTANTIKELCDEFVVAYEDGARIVYGDLEWAKTKAKASLEFGNKSVIYGAIWTDKGLIYVARMNDKGELELL